MRRKTASAAETFFGGTLTPSLTSQGLLSRRHDRRRWQRGDVKLSSICRAYRLLMALADHVPVVRVAVDERVAAPRLLVALHPCRRMSS